MTSSADDEIWAHLGDAGPQTLTDHLLGVAERAGCLASGLRLRRAGELIGLLHDLGKATRSFQMYLRSFHPEFGLAPQVHLRGRLDHSTAGAQCLLDNVSAGEQEASLRGLVARMLALCVASHHSGFIDCLSPAGADALNNRLNRNDETTRYAEAWRTLHPAVRARAEKLMQDNELQEECRRVVTGIVSKSTLGDSAVQLGLMLRLLFSCLIDADRTDTADNEKPTAAVHRLNQKYEGWATLNEHLVKGIKELPTDGAVNRLRAAISAECVAAASRPGGIYTLTVATGGGKTLAALRFALEHARQREQGQEHRIERIVFVSPYISIVDQNAAVARQYLEPQGVPYATVVLEHHSDLARERHGENGVDSWRRRVLAENWDAPVVFTTMAQVLESLFGAGTRSVRRLHALANAVLVFDEVQTIPVRLVHLFNNAINLLASHCGSTVLLCTATQPLLACVDPARGAAKLSENPELIGDVPGLFAGLRRYAVNDQSGRPGSWTREQVAMLTMDEARTFGSCLVIVNTKNDAREIFTECREAMRPDAVLVHLSTGMVPAHRTEAILQLKKALAAREAADPLSGVAAPVLCISTQLIEAGVDIDFAVVVRDLAGLDSLAQAAGRCNRNGKRSELGRMHIVELPLNAGTLRNLPDIAKGREFTRRVLSEWRRAHPSDPFPLDSPEQMRRFYELAFFDRREEMSYNLPADKAGRDTTMLELLGSNAKTVDEMRRTSTPLGRGILLQSFATANQSFELIAGTQGIVVPFGTRGREIVAALNASHDLEAEWQLLRQAQPFTLSLYESQFKELERRDAVYALAGAAGVYCLRPEFYDPMFGLRPEAGLLEELIA